MATDILKRLNGALWGTTPSARRGWRTAPLRFLRTAVLLFRDVADGQLTLRAMGLVYTTLLSLVPLLALSFSVLKAFGVHNQIQPMLQRFLAPLGESSQEITDRVIRFIENMNVGVLGSMGLALLVYTAVSLVQKIEESFNFIWHVSRPRGFGERFSRYISLLLVGPILVFSALGITASAMNAEILHRLLAIEPFGQLFLGLSRLMPYLLVIAAFTFAYYFIPNTQVRPASALIGGIVAGIAWQTAGWGFAEFLVKSGSYWAIYSGFAILILFLIWLYANWLILLLGSSVAFYHQHPEYLIAKSGEPRLSNRMRERLALSIMSCVAGNFREGKAPLTADDLAHRLAVPSHAIEIVLDAVASRGLIARIAGTNSYLPARPPTAISMRELLEIVRSAGEDRYLGPDDLPLPPGVDQVLRQMDEAIARTVGDLSLDDISRPRPETPPSPDDWRAPLGAADDQAGNRIAASGR